MGRLVTAALIALLATPALAASDKAKPDDRIVCKSEASTGSRITRSEECRRASEWREIEEARRDSAGRLMKSVISGAGTSADMSRLGKPY